MSGVIVFGGANLDIKARLGSGHIPATSNIGETHLSAGGVGRNIAHNLASLGVAVMLVSAVGDDAAAAMVLTETIRAGVDVSHLHRAKGRTGTYVAILDESGEMITAVNDMSVLDELGPEAIAAREEIIGKAKLVIADCNLPEESLDLLASLAAHKLIVEPVSVPKSAKLARLQMRHEIFVATPNRDQYAALGGTSAMQRTGRIRNMVVHQGAEGATLLTADGSTHVEAFPQAHVADVTGAGDAAVAGLAFGILNGYELEKAVRCGQAAASLKLDSRQSVVQGLSRQKMLRLVEGR